MKLLTPFRYGYVFSVVGCMFHNTALSEMCCNENYCLYTKKGGAVIQAGKRKGESNALFFCALTHFFFFELVSQPLTKLVHLSKIRFIVSSER